MTDRVLIVDDNRLLAEDLCEIFEAHGCCARAFGSPCALLAALPSIEFDAALIDVRMPEMDGISLQALLAQKCPHARFVLMTAYSDEARLSLARDRGVSAILVKPAPVQLVLEAVLGGRTSP